MASLTDCLAQSAALHRHLCPRQVLGVRMGLYAGELLGLTLPQENKRLLAIVETDGCFTDGVAVATNCWVGRRTLRVEDYGKVAATFIDTVTERAVRLVPQPTARQCAFDYAPEATSKWAAQLLGYQRIPDEALLMVQTVQLRIPMAEIVSRPGLKVHCDFCGEEIMNRREVARDGAIVCRACAGAGYYQLTVAAWVGAQQAVEA